MIHLNKSYWWLIDNESIFVTHFGEPSKELNASISVSSRHWFMLIQRKRFEKLDKFQFRWLENSVIEMRNFVSIPIRFNHPKWNSKLFGPITCKLQRIILLCTKNRIGAKELISTNKNREKLAPQCYYRGAKKLKGPMNQSMLCVCRCKADELESKQNKGDLEWPWMTLNDPEWPWM